MHWSDNALLGESSVLMPCLAVAPETPSMKSACIPATSHRTMHRLRHTACAIFTLHTADIEVAVAVASPAGDRLALYALSSQRKVQVLLLL